MTLERTILYKQLAELPDAGVYFKRLSGIDIACVPEKYDTCVEDAQLLVAEKTRAAFAYKCESILDIGSAEVTLASGIKFSGEMPPRVLAGAKQVIVYVITLNGYNSIKSQDIMTQYFVDTWGSAYANAAQAWFAAKVQAELASRGMQRTHLWCPGQHNFELENQSPLFALLHPEEIGCTLNDHFLMSPVKSISGIIGVVDAGQADMIKPCDFCRLRSKCNSTEKGCASL